MNKRGYDEVKEKPEIKYSFKIEKKDELKSRIEKMVAIKDDEKNKNSKFSFDSVTKRLKCPNVMLKSH